jgi:membrane-associated phospholipid phosphatase
VIFSQQGKSEAKRWTCKRQTSGPDGGLRGPMCALVAAVLVTTATPGLSGGPEWYTGAFHFRWRTTGGPHGHVADCRTDACDRSDFARGNLDNAFGLRQGVAFLLLERGSFRLTGGAEAQTMFTEHNLSQRDLGIGELAGVLGAGLTIGPARLTVRAGFGGVLTSDGRGGTGRFLESGVEAPVSGRVAARAAFRRAWHAGPSTDELSLTLVLRPREAADASRWAIGFSAGASRPGGLVGQDRFLSDAPVWQLTALRALDASPYRLGIGIGSASHESELRTEYGAVAGNQRGKEIFDLSLLADRAIGCTGAVCWRAGLGLRGARWEDRTPLLLDRSRVPVAAGTELAGVASLAARIDLADRIGLTARAEQTYWSGLDLGELRLMVGLEAGLPDSAPREPLAPYPKSARRSDDRGRRPSYIRRLAVDLGDLVTVPWHMTPGRWRALGWGSAAVGAAFVADNEIRSFAQRHRTVGRDDFFDTVRPLGNQAGALGVIGLIWLGGTLGDNQTAVKIGQDAFEATLFANLLMAPALKTATGRARPDAGLGRSHFDPFSGAESLPSGEAVQAFAIASVVASHVHRRWLKALTWGLAGTLSYGRIHVDRHWASDVVSGALIGAGVGAWVAHRREARSGPEGRGLHIVVLPAPGGLQLVGGMTW